MHNTSQQYRPPALPTYAQRRAEKERQLATAAGQLAGARGDDGYRERNDGLRQAVHNGSSVEEEFTDANPGHASRPLIASSSVSPLNYSITSNALAMHDSALMVDNQQGQSYRSHAAFRRPLPSPTGLIATSAAEPPLQIGPMDPNPISAARPSPLPTGSPAPSSAYARDRQRSLPQPSLPTMRTMPSMPVIRNYLPSSASAAEQIPPFGQPSIAQPEGYSLARQASTPNLQAGFSRRLPNPPSVPKLEPFSELPVESTVAPSPAISGRSRALPTPGQAPGGPAFVPVMDRSDTISSIKSLDRWEMTRHARSSITTPAPNIPTGRPLPLPQVSAPKSGLAPSRSLDRGMPRQGGFLGMANTMLARTSEVRPVTGNTITSSRTLPAAPFADQSAQSQVEDSISYTSEVATQPRHTSTEGAPNTMEEDAKVCKGQDIDHRESTRKELPVVAMTPSPPPLIVFTDASEVPKICVTQAATPTSPIVSVSHPVEPKVPNIQVGGVSGPDVSLEVEAQPDFDSPSSGPSSSPANYSGPGIFCSACDLVILGSIINAAGKRWHPDCLRCTTCGVGLEHVSRYDHDGMPYCHMDYHEQFAPKCHHCNTPIVDQRYITIDDVSLGQRFYHELHFFCGECGIPFLDPSRSSAAGTEKRSGVASSRERSEDDDQTAAFVIHGKHAFCPDCDIKLHRVKCKSCKLPIKDLDQALKALGSSWHRECFKCASCHLPIPTLHFVPIKRKPYCQECYTSS